MLCSAGITGETMEKKALFLPRQPDSNAIGRPRRASVLAPAKKGYLDYIILNN